MAGDQLAGPVSKGSLVALCAWSGFLCAGLDQFHYERCSHGVSLPVALVIAKYPSVAPDVVMFASLATVGMPFVLLVGAAPNAIAYDSKQFTSGGSWYGLPPV